MDFAKGNVDIEELIRLAKHSPAEFAKRREELIRRVIERSVPTAGLANLQLYIDASRYGGSSHISSHLRLVDMVHDSLETLSSAVRRLKEKIDEIQSQGEPINMSSNLRTPRLPVRPDVDSNA